MFKSSRCSFKLLQTDAQSPDQCPMFTKQGVSGPVDSFAIINRFSLGSLSVEMKRTSVVMTQAPTVTLQQLQRCGCWFMLQVGVIQFFNIDVERMYVGKKNHPIHSPRFFGETVASFYRVYHKINILNEQMFLLLIKNRAPGSGPGICIMKKGDPFFVRECY